MFKKATKQKSKFKIALTGPSGAGKTYSALRIAKGIGGKVAVIDTENGSSNFYSDNFDFDVLDLRPPYTTEKYIDAINAAVKSGYDILIIDSITHAWAGEGGILDSKSQMDSRGGNSWTNWSKMTPVQEKFVSSILHSNIHTICTMRSKQDYVLEVNDKGKSAPKKVGLAPIQRDGLEYEFTLVLDIAQDHNAIASKDRTSLFNNTIFTITEQTGETLINWANQGVELSPIEKIRDALKRKSIGLNDSEKLELLKSLGFNAFAEIAAKSTSEQLEILKRIE